MSYTALRVTEEGVVLYEEHARRFAPAGERIAAQFQAFAASAKPGIYTLGVVDGALVATLRAASRLFDGMPVRFVVSPFASLRGRFPKPAPPNPYNDVRLDGVSTLLTSEDGREIYESCAAAIVGWDGRKLLLPPDDRPRVASVVENALRAGANVEEAPILRDSALPLALVNAVKGVCLVDVPGHPPFPVLARETIEVVLRGRTTRR